MILYLFCGTQYRFIARGGRLGRGPFVMSAPASRPTRSIQKSLPVLPVACLLVIVLAQCKLEVMRSKAARN